MTLTFPAAAEGLNGYVEFSGAGTVAVYTEGGMPNTDLTATTADGQGGLLNVPPGSAMLSGFDQATGLELGSAEVIVRAGAVTSALLVPMPLWEQ